MLHHAPARRAKRAGLFLDNGAACLTFVKQPGVSEEEEKCKMRGCWMRNFLSGLFEWPSCQLPNPHLDELVHQAQAGHLKDIIRVMLPSRLDRVRGCYHLSHLAREVIRPIAMRLDVYHREDA